MSLVRSNLAAYNTQSSREATEAGQCRSESVTSCGKSECEQTRMKLSVVETGTGGSG